jgi:shikimate dehydrogenase
VHDDRPYLVGLIGTGVAPSLTPALHMAEAAALGVPYVYRTIDMTELHLSPEDLEAILVWCERLGFDAVNVTHPCKRDVIPLLDRVDATAAALGAVNTVLFTPEGRIGHNTDTTGFERALATGMPDADLARVTQLGAGGAGSAVADALLRLGATELTIIDLDADRATELAGQLSERHGTTVRASGIDSLPDAVRRATGIVHCTPTGMAAHPGLPFPVDLLRPELWLADIVYRPLRTELLAAAEAAGCTTLDGGRMAVFQAVDALELITGQAPDPDRMIRHFHELVAPHETPVR